MEGIIYSHYYYSHYSYYCHYCNYPFFETTGILTQIHRGIIFQKKTRMRYFQSTVMICFFFPTFSTISAATLSTSSCRG